MRLKGKICVVTGAAAGIGRAISAKMAVETRASAFQTAQRRFDAAADVIGLSDDARRGLREVKRELTVHFPVHLDDGSVHVFTGWRVQHNISRGPAKGGDLGTSLSVFAAFGLSFLPPVTRGALKG